MVSRIASSTEGNTVLLFGPQALSFNQEAFLKLRATILSTPAYQWVLDVIDELPVVWNSLRKSIPKIEVIDGAKELKELSDWIRSGDIRDDSFPLPNILLSPLVVITHLTQYANYIQDHWELQKANNTETLGFCTGILSALAVSSSSDETQFAKYSSVSVRLAMVIGALVDAQDARSKCGGSRSLATAWNSANGEEELQRILAEFPNTYVSVSYDQRRATLTTPNTTIAALQNALRGAGIIANEVGLLGRFHSDSHRNDIDSVIAFTDKEPKLQFPALFELNFPTRFTTQVEDLANGKLHHAALRQILVEKSEWHQLFESV